MLVSFITIIIIIIIIIIAVDPNRLCGLLVRVPGCRPRGLGFDSRYCQIFWVAVGLERGPLNSCEDK
jgi:hypothetical protein